VHQSLSRSIIPDRNGKVDMLPYKLPGRFPNGSMHKIATEHASPLCGVIVAVTENLPWPAYCAIPASRSVHLFGNPSSLGSKA
jgi:hypothetical protein